MVAQDPAAGATEPEGTTVRLNVAEAAEETTTGATTTTGTTTTAPTTTAPPPQPQPAVVPDVVGQELAERGASVRRRGSESELSPTSPPRSRPAVSSPRPSRPGRSWSGATPSS